eukprot:scaffold1849_cov107-Isochrysis_galbana.AAC.6
MLPGCSDADASRKRPLAKGPGEARSAFDVMLKRRMTPPQTQRVSRGGGNPSRAGTTETSRSAYAAASSMPASSSSARASPNDHSQHGSGSRLVQCPCCSELIHRALIGPHLEGCPGLNGGNGYATPFSSLRRDGPATAGAPASAAQSSAAAAPPADPADAEANALVNCPSCGGAIRLIDAYSHLDSCPGPPGPAEQSSGTSGGTGAPSAGSSAAGPSCCGESNVQEDALVCCPVCRVGLRMSEMNDHLDQCCGQTASTPITSPVATQSLQPKHIDRLAEELRCTVCMDLYDEPMFLPCGHNFCLVCITGCFRAMQQMMCPLCKAPTWRRQVTANHSLAGIVQAFKGIADASVT